MAWGRRRQRRHRARRRAGRGAWTARSRRTLRLRTASPQHLGQPQQWRVPPGGGHEPPARPREVPRQQHSSAECRSTLGHMGD
eukprot:4532092-Lingulodinium_polyedra.AAC.1